MHRTTCLFVSPFGLARVALLSAISKTKDFTMFDESVIAALLTLASLASASGNKAR